MKGKGVGVLDYEVYDGPIRKRRKTTYKCKYCGKLLSIYNDNIYCWAHTMKGWQKEVDEKRDMDHKKRVAITNARKRKEKR